ncbi:hypothetical protein Tco_1003277 [Tanacetum coccineum]|uniref:Uncharacterized protein n=1 Tax=Tanacetum coccineum TaxID=301880 RepID=A0ABQ5F979_9ASTR
MWLLDYLSISALSKGRYKTTHPSLNVIKSLIQVPRQGQVTHTKNEKPVVIDKNEILTREIQPHMKPWVDIIRENVICLGDHGKKRSRDSNASSTSTTLNHPSLFHPLDDIVDVNDEESFHSNSSSPSQNVSFASNVVSRVLQNPPHESQHSNTYLSETINLQTQHRDDYRKGLRLIGKTLKDVMSGKRK